MTGTARVFSLMTRLGPHQFVDHFVDQIGRESIVDLLLPARRRDLDAARSHLDHHVRHPGEYNNDFGQVPPGNSRSLWLGAAEPDVLSDGVPPSATGELGVVRDKGCAAVGRVDGESIVRRVVEVGLGRRPALVARVEKDGADGDGNVIVEKEPQGAGRAQPAAAWPRTAAMSAARSCG